MATTTHDPAVDAGLRLLARCLSLGAAGGAAAGGAAGVALAVVLGQDGDLASTIFFVCLGAIVGLVVGVLMQTVTALVLHVLGRAGSHHSSAGKRAVAGWLPVMSAVSTATLLVRALELEPPAGPAMVVAATVTTAAVSLSTAAWAVRG